MLGSNVAIKSYFGGIASSTFFVRASDDLLKFFSGPLRFRYSLELSKSLCELAKTVSNFSHEISENLFDSVHFCDQIVGLNF